jgi:DNA polymerase delta subunit 4
MPRGRKAASGRTSTANQATLSFNSRVTKPGTKAQRDEQIASAKKLAHVEDALQQAQAEVSEIEEPEQTEPEVADEAHAAAEQVVEEEPEPSAYRVRRKKKSVKAEDEREAAAKKITDAQVKKYWQKEEESRLAPRSKSHWNDLMPIATC